MWLDQVHKIRSTPPDISLEWDALRPLEGYFDHGKVVMRGDKIPKEGVGYDDLSPMFAYGTEGDLR